MAGAVMAARVAVARVVVTTAGLSRTITASSERRSITGRCSFMMKKSIKMKNGYGDNLPAL